MDPHNIEFLKKLYEEKLKHKDHRHIFVVQKLLFIIGLFGIGIYKSVIAEKGDEISFQTSMLLWLIPFVCAAYDIYILAEDYKVKRIGLFVRMQLQNHKMRKYKTEEEKIKEEKFEELNWEKFVSNYREPLAAEASFWLSIISLIASASIIFFVWKPTNNKEICVFLFWLVSGLFSIIFVFGIYRRKRSHINLFLAESSPLRLSADLVKNLEVFDLEKIKTALIVEYIFFNGEIKIKSNSHNWKIIEDNITKLKIEKCKFWKEGDEENYLIIKWVRLPLFKRIIDFLWNKYFSNKKAKNKIIEQSLPKNAS